ncbi:stability determinant [Cronobacter turicensis]|uniref:Stability determinant n=2 Tax=Cronobacter turicensis TaxID=413502 RepID=A0A2T7BAM0_9ENTR|nr:stability determinant [Cronobacter turicensis]EGT4492481.1 stability determinant [Cronobacter turicensis]EKM0438074.1 stability determinant [Cronobacter turicensis]ELY4322902.1 stability determinant [Cronobacter turicensis]ELY5943485.1 stability determinant [Cronobacter turicensis]ELY5964463.1 stability determinant [Cronobacter turicensis]
MPKHHSPLVFEFETDEQAEQYEQWFREKVEAAAASSQPVTPHEDVMATAREIIEGVKVGRKMA